MLIAPWKIQYAYYKHIHTNQEIKIRNQEIEINRASRIGAKQNIHKNTKSQEDNEELHKWQADQTLFILAKKLLIPCSTMAIQISNIMNLRNHNKITNI